MFLSAHTILLSVGQNPPIVGCGSAAYREKIRVGSTKVS